MKLVSSTFVSTAALFVALSFTAAQAEPQQNGVNPGGPSSGANIGAGDSGGSIGPGGDQPGQPGSTAEPSEQIGPGQGKGSKNKSAEGSLPSEGNAVQGPKGNAQAQGKTGRPGDAETGNTAETQSGTTSDKGKSGPTAESKGKAGKSARLESKDVSKVRSYFSEHKPSAHRVDRDEISVSIGIALPGAIALYDLPPDVIVVSGACPIKYFVWDDDIVLVDSCSREVIEIIADVA